MDQYAVNPYIYLIGQDSATLLAPFPPTCLAVKTWPSWSAVSPVRVSRNCYPFILYCIVVCYSTLILCNLGQCPEESMALNHIRCKPVWSPLLRSKATTRMIKYQGWEFAHFAQIKWATVSESLRLLRGNERLWVNRSGLSRQMSNRERFAQVTQRKWVNELFAKKIWAKKI